MKIFFEDLKMMIFKIDLQYGEKYMQRHLQVDLQKKSSKVIFTIFKVDLKTDLKVKFALKTWSKLHFFQCHFYIFSLYFIKIQ